MTDDLAEVAETIVEDVKEVVADALDEHQWRSAIENRVAAVETHSHDTTHTHSEFTHEHENSHEHSEYSPTDHAHEATASAQTENESDDGELESEQETGIQAELEPPQREIPPHKAQNSWLFKRPFNREHR